MKMMILSFVLNLESSLSLSIFLLKGNLEYTLT